MLFRSESLRVLRDREEGVERWLKEEVVKAYEEYRADPASAVSASEVREGAERLYRELAAWDSVGFGLSFAPAKAMSLNNIYVRWLEASDLLGSGAAAVRHPEESKANFPTPKPKTKTQTDDRRRLFGNRQSIAICSPLPPSRRNAQYSRLMLHPCVWGRSRGSGATVVCAAGTRSSSNAYVAMFFSISP